MPISIHNLCSGDQISYSLPLLVGEVQPFTTQGTVLVQSSYRNISWPVINGRFKILVELVSGINCLELKCGDDVLEFILHLKLPSFSYFVRPIYIKCREDAGEFQGPDDEDRSPNNAIRRISLAVRMLQTFTAEKLNDQGFGRRTFALETDISASSPPCHIFESQLTLAEAHSMSGSDLWTSFARELMSCDRFKQDRDRCKWFAFMSFTRYAVLPSDNPPTSHSEILSFTKGHTALGGGGLALIGTGTLHCWSQDVSEVVKRFTDTRRIDRTRFMDDSAYREFYWANYATGLGAALHELGHTFDLAHSPTGIMARGFDDINRFFIVQSCSVSSQSGVRSSPPHPASSPARVTSAVSTRSRTSSVGDGVPCSRDASPIPYSPKQSPIRRPSSMECGGGSPVFPRCHSHTNSRLSSSSTDEVNSVVIVESAFNRLHVQTAHTTRIKNYDGSDVITTTTRHKDGVETVSEATAWPDGRLVIHELVRNVSSGKTRKTTSMTVVQRKLPGTSSIGGFSTLKVLSNIPGDVPAANAVLSFQESRYRDGGAHWYRSSAVLLRYHKWFNPLKDSNSNVIELDGNVVRCTNGIRLIELRYIPEGCVGHHWEFLDENPPTEFEVCIDDLRHLVVPDNGAEMVLLVEDDNGIVLKRRVTASVLRSRLLSTQ